MLKKNKKEKEPKEIKKAKKVKKKVVEEPQYYTSHTNMPTYNYHVYNMPKKEKRLCFLSGFVAGAALGFLFYGGLGKDQFGNPTIVTYVLNILIPLIVGLIFGKKFIPIRTSAIVQKRKTELAKQFRDFLDSLATSIGVGKNVNDGLYSVYEDLKQQYEPSAFIIQELEVILDGLRNNIQIEELFEDLGKRSSNDDIKNFANVFKVSYRKGANIKEVLKNTHKILSDKMSISEEIETTLTSNKTEQNVMFIAPVILVALIKFMSPDFATNFATPAGIISTTIGIIIFYFSYRIGKEVLEIKI